MRKTFFGLLAAVVVAFTATSPADAGHKRHHHHHHHFLHNKPVVIGAVAGTLIGVGLYEGWLGNSAIATGLGGTTGGAIAGGLVGGIAVATLVHAATTPCTGFHALFGGKGCKGGKYIGRHKYGWAW